MADSPVKAGSVGVVLLCAGMGRRMGLGEEEPKAMLDLGGRPLAAHSLSVFEASQVVGSVVLVVPPGMASRFEMELVRPGGFKKVSAIADGGRTRQESVRHGLEALLEGFDPVLIHDAARPLLAPGLIAACAATAAAVGACVPATPVSCTVKTITADGLVEKTLDRDMLREAQTPQAFSASLIRDAHRRALADGIEGTDDAVLVENLGEAVAVIEGDPENLKITRPVDLDLARVLLGRRAGDRSH
jgi:2-C-methyl-D-erythritol 4-phosphate cytidylyltransferase